jgi:hypothetical protein
MGRRRNPIRHRGNSKTQKGNEKVIFPAGADLLAAESKPDQVDRGAHTKQAANQHEPVVGWVEPAIKAVSDTAPDQEP